MDNIEQLLESTSIKNIVQGIMIAESIGYDIKAYIQKRMTVYNMSERFQYRLIKEDAKTIEKMNKQTRFNWGRKALKDLDILLSDAVLNEMLKAKDFYLSYNNLTSIEGIQKLTKLTCLDLDSNLLTDIEPLEKLTKLRVLDLGDNKLTSIKSLSKLTNLTLLNLSYNQITSTEGLEKLIDLEALELSYNSLTSLKGLRKLTKLEHLHLRDNHDITTSQIATLQAALPNCKIYY